MPGPKKQKKRLKPFINYVLSALLYSAVSALLTFLIYWLINEPLINAGLDENVIIIITLFFMTFIFTVLMYIGPFRRLVKEPSPYRGGN